MSYALELYLIRIRNRQAAAKRRAFKHYDWVVPAERAYPIDKFNEMPNMTDHALLPFMEYIHASSVEQEFEKFLEANKNYIEWWYKNGDEGKAHYSISYINSFNEKALFYVDFIIRMKNGDVFLFDTKAEDSDPQAPYKHNALYEYMQLEENKAKRLHGGIIVKDKYGNWVWSPLPLDLQIGTHDTTNWEIFDPQKFI